MCSKYSHSLKGILYTCKLGEKLWRKPVQLIDTLERVKVVFSPNPNPNPNPYPSTLTPTLPLPLTPNPPRRTSALRPSLSPSTASNWLVTDRSCSCWA